MFHLTEAERFVFFQEAKLAPSVLILPWPKGPLLRWRGILTLRQLQGFTTGAVCRVFPDDACPVSMKDQNKVPKRPVDTVFLGEVQRKAKKIWTFSSAQSRESSWWWNKSWKSTPWQKDGTADTTSPSWQLAPGICQAKTWLRRLAFCLKPSTYPQCSPPQPIICWYGLNLMPGSSSGQKNVIDMIHMDQAPS